MISDVSQLLFLIFNFLYVCVSKYGFVHVSVAPTKPRNIGSPMQEL